MSKIVKPFGTLKKEIIIRADDKGLIQVEAWDYTEVVKRGFRPEVMKTPMDSRYMVLACIKVVTDYLGVMFASGIGGLPPEGSPDGKKSNHHNDPA